MLKVIHLINGLQTGGAELALFRLLSRADRSAFDMQVVSLTGDGPVGAKMKAEGIPVHSLNMSVRRPNPLAVAQLIRLLRKERPHIVQTWLQQSDLVGGLAAKVAGVGHVLWNVRHSTMHPRFIKLRTRAITRMCAWLSPYVPARIVCCSEASREEQRRLGYADDKMTVIPNGVNTTIFRVDREARNAMRQELHVAPDTLLIGAAGRFHPQKDYRTLVHGAAKVLSGSANCEVAICGDGVTRDNPDMSQWIAETGLASRFHLLGRRDDMPRFMAALDLFISASSFGEGFPNVVGEAMACALPCVVTDVGDSARIVGETGIVVAPQDPAAIADACLELIRRGPEELGRRGAIARQRIVTQFSMPRMVSTYQQLYAEIGTQ